MYYQKDGDNYTLRLEIGEDICTAILGFCREQNVLFAEISGIGAVKSAVVGLFDPTDKQYHKKELAGPLEMTSLLGSVTEKDGEPYLHLHATFSDEECRCFGGHLNCAVIGVTGEIFLRVINGTMGRRLNPENGLFIFDI